MKKFQSLLAFAGLSLMIALLIIGSSGSHVSAQPSFTATVINGAAGDGSGSNPTATSTKTKTPAPATATKTKTPVPATNTPVPPTATKTKTPIPTNAPIVMQTLDDTCISTGVVTYHTPDPTVPDRVITFRLSTHYTIRYYIRNGMGHIDNVQVDTPTLATTYSPQGISNSYATTVVAVTGYWDGVIESIPGGEHVSFDGSMTFDLTHSTNNGNVVTRLTNICVIYADITANGANIEYDTLFP